MPNVTITISTPTLTGSDYFKVRYRPVGGAYSSYQNEDNDPFQLTGLAAGQYELEVIMVKNSVECAAVIKPFTVVADFTCTTFTPVIVQNGSLFNLQITYAGAATPNCGYHIHIIGTQNNKIVNYASLPASPLLIPVINENFQLKVIADLCNGKTKECLNTDVPSITPACTPMTITGTSIMVDKIYPANVGFIVRFTWTQSNPPTTGLTLKVTQKNVLGGAPPGIISYPNGSLPIPSTNSSVDIGFLASSSVFNSFYEFDWLIVDKCGTSHTGTITILL